jgi:hypothetical protein
VCRCSIIQIAAVSIDPYKRAVITTATGAQFEVNNGGIYPVQASSTERRLLQVRRQQRPACLGGRRAPSAACEDTHRLRGCRLWKQPSF